MLQRLLTLGAAMLTALAAGCGDGPATIAGTWRSPAAWSSLVYATSKGPLLIEVHGAPFAEAPAEFRTTLAMMMTNRVFGRPTAFTADPAVAPQPRYRVVLAFNPAPATDARDLCQGTVAVSADAVAENARLTVQAAFCDGATVLASIQGWVAKVGGSKDRRFVQLMEQLTRELFGSPP
ncbi:MAG: hypothetical protein ACM3Q1_11405 [Bacteroidales bacterium]